MQTIQTAPTEINASDLQAAREFLNAPMDDSRTPRRKPTETFRSGTGTVTVHHGITRARGRSARKLQA